MLGSPGEVVAVVGDNVVLSCHVSPPEDMLSSVLEWSKLKQYTDDLSEDVDYIYIYRDFQELLDLKTPSYFGRTSLLDNGLRHGDLSLMISNVTTADSGRYKCYIPTLGSRNHSAFVNLNGELCRVIAFIFNKSHESTISLSSYKGEDIASK